ncbi:MAG TPA: hypothetical protein VNO18_23775 [Xanthobacteraceae bacterium]|jgi:hypothetical protein|nr:hypothetical protein [Xanthobacteraceae bacterium]
MSTDDDQPVDPVTAAEEELLYGDPEQAVAKLRGSHVVAVKTARPWSMSTKCVA